MQRSSKLNFIGQANIDYNIDYAYECDYRIIAIKLIIIGI